MCSQLIAAQTSRWHDTSGVKSDAVLRISPEALEQQFLTEEESRKFVATALPGRPGITLSYEALSENPQGEGRRLLRLLELPDAVLKSPLQKMETRSPRTILQNYDELKAYFAQSPWARHFS